MRTENEIRNKIKTIQSDLTAKTISLNLAKNPEQKARLEVEQLFLIGSLIGLEWSLGIKVSDERTTNILALKFD